MHQAQQRCKAQTTEGKRCSKKPVADHGYCSVHKSKYLETAVPLKEDVAEQQSESKSVTSQQPLYDQNAILNSLIESLTTLQLNVTNIEQMLKTTTQRKSKSTRAPIISRLSRAKMLYYQAQKNNSEVIRIAREELNKSEGYAKIYANKNIPWQLVKSVTDSMFDQLSESSKQEYYLGVLDSVRTT